MRRALKNDIATRGDLLANKRSRGAIPRSVRRQLRKMRNTESASARFDTIVGGRCMQTSPRRPFIRVITPYRWNPSRHFLSCFATNLSLFPSFASLAARFIVSTKERTGCPRVIESPSRGFYSPTFILFTDVSHRRVRGESITDVSPIFVEGNTSRFADCFAIVFPRFLIERPERARKRFHAARRNDGEARSSREKIARLDRTGGG